MTHGNQIIVCGSSLVMASVGACLANVPRLEVVRLAEPGRQAITLDPAVIIFDGADGLAQFPVGLRQDFPQAAYLSLDLEHGTCTRITGWSSAPVNDASDLTNIVLSLVSEKLGAPVSSPTEPSAAPEPACAAGPGQVLVTD